MAQRDKSQGFGFMYVDISKLITSTDNIKVNEDKPVITNNVRTANFNKDKKELIQTSPDVKEIQENLNRLQALHHKLHAMLEDLNKITDTKKKNT